MKLKEYSKIINRIKYKFPVKVEELRKEYNKLCFSYCCELEWDYSKLLELEKQEEVSVDIILKHAEQYASDNLIDFDKFMIICKNTRKQYMIMRKEVRDKESKTFSILEQLIKANLNDDKELIIKIIKSSQFANNPWNLKAEVSDYVVVHHNDKVDWLIDDLYSKIIFYMEYLKKEKKVIKAEVKQRKTEQIIKEARKKLPVAKSLVNQYIDSGLPSIYDFCSQFSIEESKFNEAIEIIKLVDDELYEKYSQFQEMNRGKRFTDLVLKAKKLIGLMIGGIEEDGIIREFDLIDYFRLTTFSFNELLQICKTAYQFTAEELKTIRTFVNKNRNYSFNRSKEIENELNAKRGILDESGNLIGWYTEEEREEENIIILEYLNKYKIPMNRRTYNLVRKRYLADKKKLLQDSDNSKVYCKLDENI